MKRPLSPDEHALWEANTQDVKRHVTPSVRVVRKAKIQVRQAPLPRVNMTAPTHTPAPTFVPNRRQLRTVQPYRTLDLHGYSLSEAWNALDRFLSSHSHMSEPILVITGKGSQTSDQTLSKQVPRWLHEPHFARLVKGFHQARPHHGGGGALYVFLRKQK